MTDTITLKIAQGKGNAFREATIQVENKNLVKCIFPNMVDKNTLSNDQFKKLQAVARRGGDMGILEIEDLSPIEKMEQAKINGYDEYYDIKLSDDKKKYVITLKKTGMLFPDPTIERIKIDFSLAENVFLNNNRDLVLKRKDITRDYGNAHNYDFDKLRGGDVFYLPVNQTSFINGPSGFWKRLF